MRVNWKRAGFLLWVLFGALALGESPSGGKPATSSFSIKRYTTTQLPTCNSTTNLGLVAFDTTVTRAKVCSGAAGWMPYGLPGSYATGSLPTCDSTHNLGQVAWDSTTAGAKICEGASGWVAFSASQAASTKVPIPTTGSTLAKWSFDGSEASNTGETDSVGGYTLVMWPTAQTLTSFVPGIFDNAKNTSTSAGFRTAAVNSAFYNSFATSAAWTIEFWVRPYSDIAGPAFISLNGLNYGTTDADSFLANIQYDSTNHRAFAGVCTNHTTCMNSTTGAMGSANSIPVNRWSFVALQKAVASGGNEIFSYWVNPTSATVTGSFFISTHTISPSSTFFSVGGYADSGANSGNDLSGKGHFAIDELVIEKTAKAGSTVYSDYINSRPYFVCNGTSCG